MPWKTPKAAPFPWDFVTLPEEDRAMAIGNKHGKIGDDRACDSGDPVGQTGRLTDAQTDTQTDRRAHHNTSPPLARAK